MDSFSSTSRSSSLAVKYNSNTVPFDYSGISTPPTSPTVAESSDNTAAISDVDNSSLSSSPSPTTPPLRSKYIPTLRERYRAQAPPPIVLPPPRFGSYIPAPVQVHPTLSFASSTVPVGVADESTSTGSRLIVSQPSRGALPRRKYKGRAKFTDNNIPGVHKHDLPASNVATANNSSGADADIDSDVPMNIFSLPSPSFSISEARMLSPPLTPLTSFPHNSDKYFSIKTWRNGVHRALKDYEGDVVMDSSSGLLNRLPGSPHEAPSPVQPHKGNIPRRKARTMVL